jgi:hypothetical protein
VAKFELLSDGMTYKGTFHRKGDVIDFDDDVDVKGLEAVGIVGPEGTLEKEAEEAAKLAEERTEFEAEQAEREADLNRRELEAARSRLSGIEDDEDDDSGKSPNVSAQDGPQVTKRAYNRRK